MFWEKGTKFPNPTDLLQVANIHGPLTATLLPRVINWIFERLCNIWIQVKNVKNSQIEDITVQS